MARSTFFVTCVMGVVLVMALVVDAGKSKSKEDSEEWDDWEELCAKYICL